MIDEGIYQMLAHFVATSIILFLVFIVVGLVIGSVLLALALGSFVWALIAVGYVRYCELIADQRGGLST